MEYNIPKKDHYVIPKKYKLYFTRHYIYFPDEFRIPIFHSLRYTKKYVVTIYTTMTKSNQQNVEGEYIKIN